MRSSLSRVMVRVVVAIALVACASAAAAESGPALYPHAEMNNWGRWGADDERGAAVRV